MLPPSVMRSFAWLALGSVALFACSTESSDALEEKRHPTQDPNGPSEAGVVDGDAAAPPGPGETPGPSADGGADGGATCDAASCPSGCVSGVCPSAAPQWKCADSEYQGAQYWTCVGASIYRCAGAQPLKVDCVNGCTYGPAGTNDACNTQPPPPVPVPALKIEIQGAYFTEAQVRRPLEDGLAYAVARIAKHVNIAGKTAPTLTLEFRSSTDPYASGLAGDTVADVWVPRNYPLTGDNQNYVVNISVHELGHLLAHHLIAPRSLRDSTCVNEGLASWIAGKYWMNAASAPVSSHREAARYEIAQGKASATMTTCNSASDAWYKVYASYFEYLEQKVPGGVLAVSNGSKDESLYTAAWQAWTK